MNPYGMRAMARSLGIPYSLLMAGLKEERDAERCEGLPVGYRDDYRPFVDDAGQPRCGARCRDGHPCKAKGIGKGHRCKNHGGQSTGPKTPEGRQRSLEALDRGRRNRNRINNG
jgi:hypothetical protein